jgi:hypothetical protein
MHCGNSKTAASAATTALQVASCGLQGFLLRTSSRNIAGIIETRRRSSIMLGALPAMAIAGLSIFVNAPYALTC